MDPITVVMSALSLVGNDMVRDGYNGLKGLIVRKFSASNPKLQSRIEDFEEDPEIYQSPTNKALREAGVANDQEVVDLATELLKNAEANQPGVTGGLVGQINAQGGKVVVIGGNVQTFNM
jgi:hypothetical protein